MKASERALDTAVDALAVKRITRLITEDVILEPIRERIWKRFGGPQESYGISYMITCPHCVSIWVAAGVTVARIMVPKMWSPVASGLALSAVTSILAERE